MLLNYIKKRTAKKHEATWTQCYPVTHQSLFVWSWKVQDPTFELFPLSAPSSLSLWFHWCKLEYRRSGADNIASGLNAFSLGYSWPFHIVIVVFVAWPILFVRPVLAKMNLNIISKSNPVVSVMDLNNIKAILQTFKQPLNHRAEKACVTKVSWQEVYVHYLRIGLCSP